MKNNRVNFLNKITTATAVSMIICITIGCILFVLLCTRTGAFSPYISELKWKNAPAETEYIDILAKLDNDDYTEFSEPPKWYIDKTTYANGDCSSDYIRLPIDENSEIAKLNDNGYVSLASHYKYTEALIIYGSKYQTDTEWSDMLPQLEFKDIWDKQTDLPTLYKKYGNFKAAYVSENGEVLGITDDFDVTYDPSKSYTMIANGDELTFLISDDSPVLKALFYVICIIILVLITTLIVVSIIYLIKMNINKHTTNK